MVSAFGKESGFGVCGKAEFRHYLYLINFEVKNWCCFSLSLSRDNIPPARIVTDTDLEPTNLHGLWDIIPLPTEKSPAYVES